MKPAHSLVSVALAAVLLASPSVRKVAAQPPAAPNDGAYRGYVAVRLLDDGDYEIIDELNAERFFVPASVLKVVTVATALEYLGADYRWLTRVTSRGAVTDGVLEGDLVIEPGGDPTWGAELPGGGASDPLSVLADQVRDRGVTRVGGDLVVDITRFPGRRHPVDRSYGDLPYRHGTPPTPLAMDEATVMVRVAPGDSVGEPASVTAPDGIEVINQSITVSRERHGAGTLDFVPVWGTDTLLLRGEYPISEAPFSVPATDPAPGLRVARHLREALAEVGVTIDGGLRIERQSVGPRPATAIAELRSPPLGDILERTLTESHNWYADMLTQTLAREVAGSGRFEDGVEIISDFVTGLLDDPSDTRNDAGLEIRDGSGLSASNLVAPMTVVRVIVHLLGQPWGATLVEALATPGEGTLAAWPALPPLTAKTGTLRHTVGLAGILDAERGGRVVFCYFVNHHLNSPGTARREIASALRQWRVVAAER